MPSPTARATTPRVTSPFRAFLAFLGVSLWACGADDARPDVADVAEVAEVADADFDDVPTFVYRAADGHEEIVGDVGFRTRGNTTRVVPEDADGRLHRPTSS